jgi:hypothetical protein
MSRNGKIAHLSSVTRDALNQRLDNGEEGATLLPWLNALPEVQKSLQTHFDGAPITKQNLSEWHLGGFREWQIRHDLIAQADQLAESADEMEETVETHLLAGQLATVLAARYAALLNSWDGEVEAHFVEKVRLLRALTHDIALLQRAMHQASRQKREHEQAEEDKEKRIIEEVKKETLAPLWAKLEQEQYEVVLGGGERGRKLAEVVTAVKYDLPQPKGWEEWKRKKDASLAKKAQSKSPSPTQSNPVQPSPTKSSPVTPDAAAERTPDAASETMKEGD